MSILTDTHRYIHTQISDPKFPAEQDHGEEGGGHEFVRTGEDAAQSDRSLHVDISQVGRKPTQSDPSPTQ